MIGQFDISEDRVREIVADTIRGADDGELYLEYREGESLMFDNGRLKTANFNTSQGFGLRAVAGEYDLQERHIDIAKLPVILENQEKGGYKVHLDQAYNGSDSVLQINQSYSGTGNVIYSQRQAGDYTQYSGPYPSTSTFFAPAYTSDPYLGGKRNLKVGPVNLGFGLTSMFEYNDNVNRSGTRREELLLKSDVLQKVWVLRKLLYGMDDIDAMEFLLDKIKATKNNGEFFDAMRRG